MRRGKSDPTVERAGVRTGTRYVRLLSFLPSATSSQSLTIVLMLVCVVGHLVLVFLKCFPRFFYVGFPLCLWWLPCNARGASCLSLH